VLDPVFRATQPSGLLAADFFKARVAPFLQGFYRLLYNGVAVLGLAGIWLFQRSLPVRTFDLPGSMIWEYSEIFLLISGLVVGVIALKSYDLGEFAGTSYLDKDKNKLSQKLQTQGLNAWVRHLLVFCYSPDHMGLFSMETIRHKPGGSWYFFYLPDHWE